MKVKYESKDVYLTVGELLNFIQKSLKDGKTSINDEVGAISMEFVRGATGVHVNDDGDILIEC